MNCRKCNYRLNPNASFCPKCGEKVSTAKRTNFFKDNILNIVIGILVVVIIGLVISIVGVKKDDAKNESDNVKKEDVVSKQDETEDTKDDTQQPKTEQPEKHPLNEESINTMEELMVNLIQDYAYAVNTGNPDYLDKHLVYNGEEYKSYQKMIPDFYSKGIILDVLSVEITNIERYDEDTFRANIITEYEIANSDELRYQKETIDYLIKSKGNGIFLVDKSENYKMLDRYTIESYGY